MGADAGVDHDVDEYLDARGWTSVSTSMADLLAANGFDPFPQSPDNQALMNGFVYYTSSLH